MASSQGFRKFPKGQKCDICNSTRWYVESGLKFCQEGHQIDNFVEYDIDKDDNFTAVGGKVTRKKREAKEKQYRNLSGNEAKELYLECLQFILRKQIIWLVQHKDLSRELESVCRDLWDWRIRKFVGLNPAVQDDDEAGKASAKSSQNQSGSDSEMTLFSSQAETGASTEDEKVQGRERKGGQSGSGIRSWESETWALPGAVDTLAIVYLGCLLIQEPVRIGDIYRWARDGRLPFLGAIELVPKDLTSRLPGWANRSLLTRYAKFEGSELHRAVMALMLGYKKNYAMAFPTLPVQPLLLCYLKDLALPPEVHPYAQEICKLLSLEFSFPTRRLLKGTPPPGPGHITRHMLLDIPDILLVASTVLATKYLYPMDGVERFPRNARDPLTLKMDWAAWEAEFADKQHEKKPMNRLDFENMDPDKVYDMSEEEMNEYLNWFQEARVERRQKDRDETEIERLFPLQPVPPPAETSGRETPEEEVEARMLRVQKAMSCVQPRPEVPGEDEDEVKRLGYSLLRYKTVEQLSGPAKRFHEKAAEIAGLSLGDLVSAVYSLEHLLSEWERRENRRLRDLHDGGYV
ncbi:hypothetical protein B0T22DRAFT_146131 [Podospora appendiculata]|uniref:RRN7-type domain-containing protein n=1 Tax=Podospora appendiculata TaxID=314037 RepID=A0AAE0X8W2_9PEZI|nr:hypothetical protein B0T22DRAFT_146131 [Podospora appendiculata]